jgi:DNA-binding NtrC family response regulator
LVPDPDEDLSTILAAKAESDPAAAASYVLRVVEGPAAGRAFAIDSAQPSRILIGESPACEIRLGDRQVSRRQAALDLMGRRLRITDLGSSNGTFVDGVQVLDACLHGGEIVRVGASALAVERQEAATLLVKPSTATCFGRFLGASAAVRRLYPFCERLGASTVPVVIEGETGTGKEVLAEALHEMGPRAQKPFVVFDCAGVPPNLMESELFGHERGAFTGAVGARKGVFELASGGTLLIDEIGDLDLPLQAKLLRVVERSDVRRLGADRPIPVDVRLLAATRRDLDQEVQAGRFRDDLFHRLAVTRIELPPLRQRTGDVTLLARAFWKDLGGSPRGPTAEQLLRWETDPWPGNVRGLRNAVARQIALGELASEAPSDEAAPPPAAGDPDFLAAILRDGLPLPRARERVVQTFERMYIERILEQHGGDTARAAAASGIARRYFNLLRARSR